MMYTPCRPKSIFCYNSQFPPIGSQSRYPINSLNPPRLLFVRQVWLALWLALLISPALARANPPQVQITIPAGEYSYTQDKRLQTEAVLFPPSLTTALLTLPLNGVLEVSEFPIVPGVRTPLVLRRYDVYAPGARIFAVDGSQLVRQLPRSQRHHFLGFDPHDATTRIGFSLDPDTHELRGLSIGSFGKTEIVPLEKSSSSSARHEIRDTQLDTSLQLETTCGSDHLPLPPHVQEQASLPPSLSSSLPRAKAAGTTHTAIIAVDTDNEFNHKKFGNDTTAAANWIADLLTAMNVIYERDLSLLLMQGDTFLRRDLDIPPTYDDDPWSVLDSSASPAQLDEFGIYWAANMGAVSRVFATLLSGKSPNAFSASGIAWLDGYCEPQSVGGGYSVNQVFTATIPVSSDAGLVGHELGHNAGSPHTHCYSPPVDTCFALESGCYTGPVSCPVAGQGTLMSYCHFSNGADCGASRDEFHPTVVNLISGFITSHTPSCIQTLALDFLFTDGFESGDTSAWSSTVP